MGREAVAQCVGCCRVWQPQCLSGPSGRLLHDTLGQWPALGPPEEGLISAQRPRTLSDVISHRFPHDGQDRHNALFAALAGDGQSFTQRDRGP